MIDYYPSTAVACSSDGVHEVALGGIEKDSDLAGMDQAVFAAAPPEAMRGLMQVCGLGLSHVVGGWLRVNGLAKWRGRKNLFDMRQGFSFLCGSAFMCLHVLAAHHCLTRCPGSRLPRSLGSTSRSGTAACGSTWST